MGHTRNAPAPRHLPGRGQAVLLALRAGFHVPEGQLWAELRLLPLAVLFAPFVRSASSIALSRPSKHGLLSTGHMRLKRWPSSFTSRSVRSPTATIRSVNATLPRLTAKRVTAGRAYCFASPCPGGSGSRQNLLSTDATGIYSPVTPGSVLAYVVASVRARLALCPPLR